MLKGAVIVTVLATTGLVASEAARASTEVLSVRGVDTVLSPGGEYRVFFQLEISLKSNQAIRRAILRMPHTAQGGLAGDVRLRVMPVTTDWTLGSATWTGWTRAGGDYDEEIYADVVVSRARETTVQVDVTSAVKEWKEERQMLYGFVVTAHSSAKEGLDAQDLSVLDGLGLAELEIDYMPLTGPRSARKGTG